MEVNDSIFIPLKEGDNGNRLKNRLSQATRTYGKKQDPQQHFILRYRLEKRSIRCSSLEERLMSAHEQVIKELREALDYLACQVDEAILPEQGTPELWEAVRDAHNLICGPTSFM